jgi:hypothetical protein
MTPKKKRPAEGSSNDSRAYNPLDLRVLAENMARVVLEQPLHPLGDVPSFKGAGVYVIYYTGDHKLYTTISSKNRDLKWGQPIYIGEAARKGARKGGVLAEGPPGPALSARLKNHAQSIREVEDLEIGDFWCRYLVIEDFFIPLCESLLIDRYTPVWNKVVDGFGNKTLGVNRTGKQAISMWDLLHKGRTGVGTGARAREPKTRDGVARRVQDFLSGKPVDLISTTKAIEDAEGEGAV